MQIDEAMSAEALVQLLDQADPEEEGRWRRAAQRIQELEREVARLREEAARRGATEAERFHAEKLDALGRLAAGLSHEINTPLQFIGDNLAFLAECHQALERLATRHRALHTEVERGRLTPTSAVAEAADAERVADLAWVQRNVPAALAECNDGLRRVREIVQSLKDFARPIDAERHDADVNEALMRALVMARPEYAAWAEVQTDLGDVPRTLCTLTDLHQVFYNLLLNASQAIVERKSGHGVIQVRTRRDGEFVAVTITDNGCGIPEALQPRLFEDAFAHPREGRSSARGLSIAWALVVQKNGGVMRFESSVGRGTSFCVLLPAFVDPTAALAAASARSGDEE